MASIPRSAALAAAFLISWAVSVRAELCSIDAVPAATLLLPYFELDPSNPNGETTIFSINNAAPEAVLTHVTLWTNWAEPTLSFDVYLTGYDVQTINLRDLFNGRLPDTAPAGQDPQDRYSPQGVLSEDHGFPGCESLPYPYPISLGVFQDLVRAHRGLESGFFGGCVAQPFEDQKVRGYLTVDTVGRCSFSTPADAEYWQAVATAQNVLWGNYFVVDPENNSAEQENLVHLEACDGSDSCRFAVGAPTFYGRYASNAADQREPLPSTFAASYLNGGAFDGGTRLVMWRDTRHPAGFNGACGAARPSWFPLDAREVVAFDEAENAESLCVGCPNCSPPYDSDCYTLATQVVGADDPVPDGYAADRPFWEFGWLILNLSPPTFQSTAAAQAWVTVFSSAAGRFSVATDAVALDDLCSPDAGQTILNF